MLSPALVNLLVMAPLVVVFVRHALSRATLDGRSQGVIWIVLLILMAPFATPIYWYAHVFAPPPSSENSPGE